MTILQETCLRCGKSLDSVEYQMLGLCSECLDSYEGDWMNVEDEFGIKMEDE